MRTINTRLRMSLLFACAEAAVMVMALGAQASGQARPNAPQPSPATVTNPAMHDREANITLLERGKDEANRKDAALKQMNEDFQRIQTTDAEMMDAFVSANPPDYDKISVDAADIRVRASRLRDQLALPAAGKPEKRAKEPDIDKDDLRASLSRLSDSIKSFVSNPIFQQQAPQQVDHHNGLRARLDLDDIIRLSSRIAKAAGEQKKD